MSATHTKGPWQFIENTIQPTRRKAFDGCNICRVTMPHDGLAAEAMANARLITAAPDLLAACKHVLSWAGRANVINEPEDETAMAVVRAAIDKAEGK